MITPDDWGKTTNVVRVVINISGEVYETTTDTLNRFPQTLLGNSNKLSSYFCRSANQHFFQRSRRFFDAILFFYQSNGVLRCPPSVRWHLFEQECRFFQLPEESIESIRPKQFMKWAKNESTYQQGDEASPSRSVKSKIWDILQNPETSGTAAVFAVLSLFMIFLSVLTSCLESVPSLRSSEQEKNSWESNELFLNSWFLMELAAGILSSPNTRRFLTSPMTWIDIIAVIPYFIVVSISRDQVQSLGFMRIVRLVRITRLFRLSKHSSRLKMVGNILLSSLDEFKTLSVCLLVIVILSGSLMYFLEERGSNGSEFCSIPMGLYWAVQSVTTVGYGDIYPRSLSGRMFASAFMVAGALTMSIPLLSIVSKFEAQYHIKK